MRAFVSSVIAVVVFTAVFGFAYPVLMTGFAQVAFPEKADGSLIEQDGEVIGSRLAAQAFTQPEYFHPRPSAVEYNAAGTSFANLGPTSPDLAAAVDEQTQAVLDLEGRYNPGLVIGDIPVDAVTTSGSGIDPTSRPRTPSSRPRAWPRSARSHSSASKSSSTTRPRAGSSASSASPGSTSSSSTSH
jgi:K+-transporting ATPase ATPase C chain